MIYEGDDYRKQTMTHTVKHGAFVPYTDELIEIGELLTDIDLDAPLTRWERIRYGILPDLADRFRAAWGAFRDPWGYGR